MVRITHHFILVPTGTGWLSPTAILYTFVVIVKNLCTYNDDV